MKPTLKRLIISDTLMHRLSTLSIIVSIVVGVSATPLLGQERIANPVVLDAEIGTYKHGTYAELDNKTHVGVNLLNPCGAQVHAFADGTVVDLVEDTADGNYDMLGYTVILEHPSTLLGEPFYTAYFHMADPPLVTIGTEVFGGKTVIGNVGDTGVANECYTHFEIRAFGSRLSPEWNGLYGEGDLRNSDHFYDDWDDPLDFFLIYPEGISQDDSNHDINDEQVLIDEEAIYTIVEETPELVGGLSSLYENIQYPKAAKSNNIEGRVFIQFVVTKEGKVKDTEVIKGIGYGCDEAARDAVKKALFKPGKHKGEVVNVRMSLPIVFKL